MSGTTKQLQHTKHLQSTTKQLQQTTKEQQQQKQQTQSSSSSSSSSSRPPSASSSSSSSSRRPGASRAPSAAAPSAAAAAAAAAPTAAAAAADHPAPAAAATAADDPAPAEHPAQQRPSLTTRLSFTPSLAFVHRPQVHIDAPTALFNNVFFEKHIFQPGAFVDMTSPPPSQSQGGRTSWEEGEELSESDRRLPAQPCLLTYLSRRPASSLRKKFAQGSRQLVN